MTREEIQELLSAANVTLASARSRTKPGKLRVAIGDAQDYIYRARRALEAEKPLAVVHNFLAEIEPGDAESGYEVRPHFWAKAGLGDSVVRIIIILEEEP